jgi:hypothetical protein
MTHPCVAKIRTALLLLLLLAVGCAAADDRKVLSSKDVSPALQGFVDKVARLTTPQVPYADLTRTSPYFVRIAPRKVILDDNNRVTDNAILSTKPLVFVTTPESIYGKSLLDIYLDIGYEAEDIIRWQRDVNMVAVVFRFPDGIAISDVRDGALPDTWKKAVFVPTWANAFALFDKLAAEATIEPTKTGEFAPERLFFRSQADHDFVLGFPAAGRERVRTVPYAALRETGGADWAYRDLLEKKLSIFEHFRGNGHTQNEVIDPNGKEPLAGLLEFVGPNRKIKDLPEFAIIDLGALTVRDSYAPTKP